jgi:hypothetical protein
MITIIIPIHPQEKLEIIYKCLNEIEKNYSDLKNIDEVILVSCIDKNVDILKYKFKINIIVKKELNTRSNTMNYGFDLSKSNINCFLHVDTFLPNHYDILIINKLKQVDFCFFELKFDDNHFLFRGIEYSVNSYRCFPYGDQCFCVNRNFHLKYGKFPDIPVMEDFAYIENIPKENRKNVISGHHALTSARRYKCKNGFTYKSITKNVLNNKKLIKMYQNNHDIIELSKIYYKNELLGTSYYE